MPLGQCHISMGEGVVAHQNIFVYVLAHVYTSLMKSRFLKKSLNLYECYFKSDVFRGFLSPMKIFSDIDLKIMVVYADFEEMMIDTC